MGLQKNVDQLKNSIFIVKSHGVSNGFSRKIFVLSMMNL